MGNNLAEPQAPGWLQAVLIGRRPRRTAIRIAVLVVVSFVVFTFVLLPIRVEGISMLPAYQSHRINFVNRLAYVIHPPQRGDVVAIRMAGERAMLMKRIVGLPNEMVGFHDGHLTINGQEIAEPYLKLPCFWEVPPVLDGPDEYYVVGDNRSMRPLDHVHGRAIRARIVGKVLL